MAIYLTRRYRFSASHRLHSPHLTWQQNRNTYGKCNNPFGHGHDYVLDVQITGEIDPVTGLILPLAELDEFVDRHVLRVFSHRDLNRDVPEFEDLVPTTENVALVIANRLLEHWAAEINYPCVGLTSIIIEETDRNRFEVLVPQHSHNVAQMSELKEGLTIHA